MISESVILSLQSVAAVLMATDYFLTEKQRDVVNEAIQKAVSPVREQAGRDVMDRLRTVAENAISITVALVFLLIGWLGSMFLLPVVGKVMAPWAVGAAAIVLLGLFGAALPKLLAVFITELIPLAMSASMGLAMRFLIRCPKGTVFGVGFVFLVASFTCRWYNV